MKITVRSRGTWRKVTFKIPDETFERIEKISKRYGFRTDETIRIILLYGYLEGNNESEETFKELEDEISKLERELYQLEGKWSPLKFTTYYLAMDNQNLAIQLSGMMAENKRLRKMLGKPGRDFSEIERLIHIILFSNS
jgi:hypothetical protein